MTKALPKDKNFWDRMAGKYAQKPVDDEEAYQIKLEMTREYFTPQTDVFEFGCGTGTTALYHAPHVVKIDAMDLSSEMIRIAQQKADKARIQNVIFSQGDIADLNDRQAHYDVVLGMSILHLLRDRQAITRKVHMLLKPGGVFISSTACLGDHMGYMKPFLTVGRWIGKIPFVSFFTQEQLVRELTETGFEIVHQWQPKKNAGVFLVARKLS